MHESPLLTRAELWRYLKVSASKGKTILKKHPEFVAQPGAFGDRMLVYRERVDDWLRQTKAAAS